MTEIPLTYLFGGEERRELMYAEKIYPMAADFRFIYLMQYGLISIHF